MNKFGFLLFLIAFSYQCQTIEKKRDLGPSYGKIIGNTYKSKKGNFQCYIPVDRRYATLRDGKYKVSFQEKNSGLYKIQAVPLSADAILKIKTSGNEAFLKEYIQENLIKKIKNSRPSSELKYEEYNSDFRNGVYFILLDLGFPISDKPSMEKTSNRYAIMSFLKDSFIYLVIRDLEEKENLTPENEIQTARENLIDFHSRIHFASVTDSEILDGNSIIASEEDEDENDDQSEEEEENSDGAIGSASTQLPIDLDGIIKTLKRRLHVPGNRFKLTTSRFKINTHKLKINSSRFKTNSRFHIKSSKSRFSSPGRHHR